MQQQKPLAECRAVICAALWPDPVDELCPQAFRDEAPKIINQFAKKALERPISLRQKQRKRSCDRQKEN